MQWINSLAGLLDVLGDGIGQQLVDDLLQVRAGDIASNDIVHLLANSLDLTGLGVASFAMR